MRTAVWLHFAISATRFLHPDFSSYSIKANSYDGQNKTHFLPMIRLLKSMARFKKYFNFKTTSAVKL
jgi:hypothetical protein